MRKVVILALVLVFNSCAKFENQNNSKIKNVIFIIGDGMGPQQLSLLQLYASKAPRSIYNGKETNFQRMANNGKTGIVYTQPFNKLVTDSSCSATQYATGEFSLPEVVGIDGKGNSVKTVLEIAKERGLSTGLVSDTRLTHATPASFAAHNPSRKDENNIAKQMILTGADVMYSGGLRHFIPKGAKQNKALREIIPSHLPLKSKRKDNENLLELAKEKGYSLVFSKKQMENSTNNKALGLFSSSGMPDGIEDELAKNSSVPTLKDMSMDAISKLSTNPKGFFLMVEAGQIDWAGHRNDAGTMLHEMLKMDNALGAILDWADKRDDTLVVITADHETGSFGFSYSGYNVLQEEDIGGDWFSKKKYKAAFNYGSYDVLDKLFEQKKSYTNMIIEFGNKKHGKDVVGELRTFFNKNTSFPITREEAAKILRSRKNQFYHPTHKTLKAKTMPHLEDFDAFYSYGEIDRSGLMGRVTAKYNNIVWGTASHTSTPVVVVAHGKNSVINWFNGAHHSTEVGKKLIEIIEDIK